MQDTQIYNLISKEEDRQRKGVELIPSENYASTHVRTALSSALVNKYSEGYPGKRYYGGNEIIDYVESIAQNRAKELFGVEYANVQPYSGSPANLAVYLATCKPGDAVMGQALVAGGHLTHGHMVSATGIFFNSLQYGVMPDVKNGELFDYAEIRALALKHKPKLIWVGATAYPLLFKYEKFAEIAEEVGADGLLIVTPFYNKTTQNGLVAHYKHVANNGTMPIILYKVPSRTGLNLTADTCLQLSKISGVVGKFTFPSQNIVSLLTSSFTIKRSFGERPVKTPVLTATAPDSVTAPFSNPTFLVDISATYNSS